jgi:hypothetical protein
VSLRIAGVDEAGRGPLAGPVAVAAVILDPSRPIAGLGDSKALSEARRDALEPLIRERALAWHVEWVSAAEIDRLNILRATLEGMARAVNALRPGAERALIDGDHGGLDPGQGRARPLDARTRRPAPGLRLRRAQWLSDTGAPGNPAPTGPLRRTPAQFRAGARLPGNAVGRLNATAFDSVFWQA